MVHRLASLQQQSGTNQTETVLNLANNQSQENGDSSQQSLAPCKSKKGHVGGKNAVKDTNNQQQLDEQRTNCYVNSSAAVHGSDIAFSDGTGLTNIMGSNVSRHSAKGLSGRRVQSEGLFEWNS